MGILLNLPDDLRCTLDADQLHALVLHLADEHMAVENLAAELATTFLKP